jgi:hypothetical protein
VLAKLRERLTFANVISVLALFVALGGSSYAALTVTGKNVKNSSLTGKDVKNNSLTGTDVKRLKSGDVSDHSLLSKDFKTGQLPAGPRGADGKNGTNGFGLLSYPFFPFDVATAEVDSGGVLCDPGTFPTGGDALAFDTDPAPPNDPLAGVIVAQGIDFDPDSGAPDGYFATWDNTTGSPVTVFVDAVCANASTVQAKAKGKGTRVHAKRLR